LSYGCITRLLAVDDGGWPDRRLDELLDQLSTAAARCCPHSHCRKEDF